MSNWVPYNPDGSFNGDGQFAYTDDYYVHSDSPVTNHIWHRVQRFTLSNNGNNLSMPPDEVVCQ